MNLNLLYDDQRVGKDISVVADGAGLKITAAFSPADTPPWKLAQILQDLNGLHGVLRTEVVENPHPVRQNFSSGM